MNDLRSGRKVIGKPVNGKRKKTAMQLDYEQYGEEAFEAFVLEENVPHSEGSRREHYWIEEYKATDPQYGYNIRHEKRPLKGIPIHKGLPPKPMKGE